MAKIKFMGSSHVHNLAKGDDFGGRLSEGLSSDVTFNKENNWVVDSEEAGLSEEAVKILTESGDFKDVTDLKSVPANEHQKIFLGMGSTDKDATRALSQEEVPEGQNLPEGDEPAQGSPEADPTPGTTVGGSTRRTRGTS